MPNKNYLKGRGKEYRLKKKYEMMGYIVLRTAGSHGFADLVCVEPRKKEIIFIQAKPNNFRENEIIKLEKENNFCNGTFEIRFEVI